MVGASTLTIVLLLMGVVPGLSHATSYRDATEWKTDAFLREAVKVSPFWFMPVDESDLMYGRSIFEDAVNPIVFRNGTIYKVPLREVDTCLPGATQVE